MKDGENISNLINFFYCVSVGVIVMYKTGLVKIWSFLTSIKVALKLNTYRKDTEPLYHAFMYSLIITNNKQNNATSSEIVKS